MDRMDTLRLLEETRDRKIWEVRSARSFRRDARPAQDLFRAAETGLPAELPSSILEEQTIYWNPNPSVTRAGCDENRFSSFHRLEPAKVQRLLMLLLARSWNR